MKSMRTVMQGLPVQLVVSQEMSPPTPTTAPPATTADYSDLKREAGSPTPVPSGPLPRSPPESLLCPQGPLVRAAIGGLGAEAGLIIGYYGYAEFGRDDRKRRAPRLRPRRTAPPGAHSPQDTRHLMITRAAATR
jgi:hypothetical protein